ncbi:hypothetical protein HGRIS_008745 [Hohenbuehelia grisea]|uniref:Uncharacterized protein n=1 Tax=Hohenbuehelia grisea TaxID=104357 RepID=A0ABR3J991_9AGAR
MSRRYQSRTPPLARMDPQTQGIDAKIVVLGGSGVGKTTLLHRYTQPRSPFDRQDSGASSFVTKKVQVDGVKVRLQLWDTSAQEPFRSMVNCASRVLRVSECPTLTSILVFGAVQARMYYRGADAALLLYDSNDASTLNDVRRWLEGVDGVDRLLLSVNIPFVELQRNAPDLLVYVVGTKADILAHSTVTTELARTLVHKWFPPAQQPRAPPPSPVTKSRTLSSCLSLPFRSFTSIASMTGSTERQSMPSSVSPRSRYDSGGSASAPLLRRALSEKPVSGQVETPKRTLHQTRSLSELTLHFFQHGRNTVDSVRAAPESKAASVASAAETLQTSLAFQLKFFEVSARDNLGVRDLFHHLVTDVVKRSFESPDDEDDMGDGHGSDDGLLATPPGTPMSSTPSISSYDQKPGLHGVMMYGFGAPLTF